MYLGPFDKLPENDEEGKNPTRDDGQFSLCWGKNGRDDRYDSRNADVRDNEILYVPLPSHEDLKAVEKSQDREEDHCDPCGVWLEWPLVPGIPICESLYLLGFAKADEGDADGDPGEKTGDGD